MRQFRRFSPRFKKKIETQYSNLVSCQSFINLSTDMRTGYSRTLKWLNQPECSQERETYKFNTLRKVMRELLEWRRQLLAGTLTTDQTRELKLRIINKVDWGNRWVKHTRIHEIQTHNKKILSLSSFCLSRFHSTISQPLNTSSSPILRPFTEGNSTEF